MTYEELTKLAGTTKPKEIAKIFGVQTRAVERWRTGESKITLTIQLFAKLYSNNKKIK